jgi:Cu+-exporting ATPase
MPEVPAVVPENFREIPGLGIQGKVQGRELKIGSAAFVGAEGQGLFVSVDGQIKGHYDVKSRYRDGLLQILAYFRQAKPASWFAKKQSDFNHVWLLSGDQDREATALAPFFPDRETMLFERSPQDKLEFVKKLQRHGRQVMMLGDGLNDAGALRQSNLGVVVAEDTNNFTPACDAILHADEFENLPKYVKLAHAGVKTVKWSYAVALIYNIIGLSYSVTGHLSPLVAAVLMPTSSISIVIFGVLMSNWAAHRILK